MSKQRKSYLDLEAEITELIRRKEALLDEAGALFTGTLLTNDVKNRLAELPNEVIKMAAKNAAKNLDENIDNAIRQYQERMQKRSHQNSANIPPHSDN